MATNTVSLWAIIKTRGQQELLAAWHASEGLNASLRETSASSGQLDRNMKGAAKASSNTTKEFSKMAQGLGGLVHAYATIAANVFAVTAAFNILRSAARVEQLTQSMTAFSIATGAATRTTVEGLKKISQGALSTEQAMRSVAQATAAGFDAQQINDIAQVATNASKVLGRDTADSIDRLVRGLTKLEPELIDELGLMTRVDDAVRKYADSVNKSATDLTTYERRMAFANAVLDEGITKFGELGDLVEVNPYDKIATSIENLGKQILNLFGGPIASVLETITENALLLVSAFTLLGAKLTSRILPDFSEQAANMTVMAEQAEEFSKKMLDKELIAAVKTVTSQPTEEIRIKATEVTGLRDASDKALDDLKNNGIKVSKEITKAMTDENIKSLKKISTQNTKAMEEITKRLATNVGLTKEETLLLEKQLRDKGLLGAALSKHIAYLEQNLVLERLITEEAKRQANYRQAETRHRKAIDKTKFAQERQAAATVTQNIGMGAGIAAAAAMLSAGDIGDSMEAAAEGAKDLTKTGEAVEKSLKGAGDAAQKAGKKVGIFTKVLRAAQLTIPILGVSFTQLIGLIAEFAGTIFIIIMAIEFLIWIWTKLGEAAGSLSEKITTAEESYANLRKETANAAEQQEHFNRLLQKGYAIDALAQRANSLAAALTNFNTVARDSVNALGEMLEKQQDIENSGFWRQAWDVVTGGGIRRDFRARQLFSNELTAAERTIEATLGKLGPEVAKKLVKDINARLAEKGETLLFTYNVEANDARTYLDPREDPLNVEEAARRSKIIADVVDTSLSAVTKPAVESAEALTSLREAQQEYNRELSNTVRQVARETPFNDLYNQLLNTDEKLKEATGSLGDLSKVNSTDLKAYANAITEVVDNSFLASLSTDAQRALVEKSVGEARALIEKAAGLNEEQAGQLISGDEARRIFAAVIENVGGAVSSSKASLDARLASLREAEQINARLLIDRERLNALDTSQLDIQAKIADNQAKSLNLEMVKLRAEEVELQQQLVGAKDDENQRQNIINKQRLNDQKIELLRAQQLNLVTRAQSLTLLDAANTQKEIIELAEKYPTILQEASQKLSNINALEAERLAMVGANNQAIVDSIQTAIEARKIQFADLIEFDTRPQELLAIQNLDRISKEKELNVALQALTARREDLLTKTQNQQVKDEIRIVDEQILLAQRRKTIELDTLRIKQEADLQELILRNIEYQNKFPPSLANVNRAAEQIWWKIGRNMRESIADSTGFVEGAAQVFENTIDAAVDSLVDGIIEGGATFSQIIDDMRQALSDSLGDMAKDLIKMGVKQQIVAGIELINPRLAEMLKGPQEQILQAQTETKASVDTVSTAVTTTGNNTTSAVQNYAIASGDYYNKTFNQFELMVDYLKQIAKCSCGEQFTEATPGRTTEFTPEILDILTQPAQKQSDAAASTAAAADKITEMADNSSNIFSNIFDMFEGGFKNIIDLVMKALSFTGTSTGGGGGGGGDYAGAIMSVARMFFAENGGIMTSRGPINTYSTGGVANSPQMAIFGEGRMPEAYVPLPDGQSIPVTMEGGSNMQNNVSVAVNIDNNGGASTNITTDGAEQMAGRLGVAISNAVKQEIMNQKRPGGLLGPGRR